MTNKNYFTIDNFLLANRFQMLFLSQKDFYGSIINAIQNGGKASKIRIYKCFPIKT